MPRYLEQLNECTDPTSGDWLGIVDVSAGATDKDRKVDVGKFARLAAANTFTAAQTISYNTPALTLTSTGVGSPRITLTGGDFGTDRGCILSLGRNSNVDTPAAGYIYLMTRTGSSQRLWADNTGLLRIGGVDPVFANDTAGTVVGAQTSSLDAKTVLGDPVEGAAALACVPSSPSRNETLAVVSVENPSVVANTVGRYRCALAIAERHTCNWRTVQHPTTIEP